MSDDASVASVNLVEFGHLLTVWTARVAAALYVLALALLLARRSKQARVAFTIGIAAYLLHLWCAFEYFYSWSHAVAYGETARQTAELFGVPWGGGLYLNYLFTLVWFADCAFSWWRLDRWSSRNAWATFAIHAYLAFIVVNATIVVWVLRWLL